MLCDKTASNGGVGGGGAEGSEGNGERGMLEILSHWILLVVVGNWWQRAWSLLMFACLCECVFLVNIRIDVAKLAHVPLTIALLHLTSHSCVVAKLTLQMHLCAPSHHPMASNLPVMILFQTIPEPCNFFPKICFI